MGLAAVKLLDVVELPIGAVYNGAKFEDGARGTIVYEWPSGLVEVEFDKPQIVVCLNRNQLKLVEQERDILYQHITEVRS
jgi:hypothetical protein